MKNKPHWFETIDYGNLAVHNNPGYIDSMGEKTASVCGEIYRPTVKDPCGSHSVYCRAIPTPNVDRTPATWERWAA